MLKQSFLVALCLASLRATAVLAQQATAPQPGTVLHTSVHRVVVDVIVTDSEGKPVPNLTREDFRVQEDGQPQQLLSFESSGFSRGMDYLPPKLPDIPPDTFLNLPAEPEKGPLYVLLLDLVNADNQDEAKMTDNNHSDQMWGRQQLVKFIRGKPEGARFAIFVWSNGLHLIQGFTSDKAELYAAIDPRQGRPHVPQIYLMGANTGRGSVSASISVLTAISDYLQGLAGRKNLIWFSSGFPLSFFPSDIEPQDFIHGTKSVLNKMAQNQIAIYPVDMRGVIAENQKSPSGQIASGPDNADKGKSLSADPHPANHASGSPAEAAPSGAGGGISLNAASYNEMDEIARYTGGRAYYSTNDAAAALTQATEHGASYYSLSYSPSNHHYDGKLRTIQVRLSEKGYRLDYRRAYYGLDSPSAPESGISQVATTGQTTGSNGPRRPEDDRLSAIMRHGAPSMHQLLFGVQVQPSGTPMPATPLQMTALAAQNETFAKSRHGKPLPSIPLQHYRINFILFGKELAAPGTSLEFAVAAYDSDGNLLNASVQDGTSSDSHRLRGAAEPPSGLRVQQDLDVPLTAVSLRFAVSDRNSDRIGALEIKLPLAAPAEATSPAQK